MFVVAGATGHVGSVVAEELLKNGKRVRVIVRSKAKGNTWLARGAEAAIGSLEDPEFLADALKNAKGFFALVPPNFEVADVFSWQKATADSIAKAVKKSGVPYVVALSSIGAELREGTGPIKGVHYLENQLNETGVKLTALRPVSFQENIHGAIAAAKSAGIFPNFSPSENTPMPMIATKDIGHAAADALTKQPEMSEVIDLAGPEYTPHQLAQQIGEALGKSIKVVTIPPSEHVSALKNAGVPPGWAELFAEMYKAMSEGKLTPHGDRLISCKTPIAEVITRLSAI